MRVRLRQFLCGLRGHVYRQPESFFDPPIFQCRRCYRINKKYQSFSQSSTLTQAEFDRVMQDMVLRSVVDGLDDEYGIINRWPPTTIDTRKGKTHE